MSANQEREIVQETPQKKTKVYDTRNATFNFVWMLSLLFPAKFPTIQPIICPCKFLIGSFLATWPKYRQVGHSEKRPGLPVWGETIDSPGGGGGDVKPASNSVKPIGRNLGRIKPDKNDFGRELSGRIFNRFNWKRMKVTWFFPRLGALSVVT